MGYQPFGPPKRKPPIREPFHHTVTINLQGGANPFVLMESDTRLPYEFFCLGELRPTENGLLDVVKQDSYGNIWHIYHLDSFASSAFIYFRNKKTIHHPSSYIELDDGMIRQYPMQ